MPYNYRIPSDSIFRLESWSSSASLVQASIVLTRHGDSDVPFRPSHTASSDRTSVQSDTGRVGRAGEVTSAGISPVAGLKRGQLYASISVLDSRGDTRAILCNGYVHETKGLTLGEYEDSTSGRGFMRVISLGNPAAGADYTDEPVPTNARWKVHSFFGQLVTDGTGATRSPIVQYDDGTNVYAEASGGVSHIATRTLRHAGIIGANSWWVNFQSATDGMGNPIGLPDVYMEEGDNFGVDTVLIQAGDDWGEGFIQVEEWIAV